MTVYDAWLTTPDAPRTAVAWFPDGKVTFFYLRDAIQSGRLAGAQVDHLVWRATVSRTELERTLVELCGREKDDPLRTGWEPPRATEQRVALRRYVSGMTTDEACYLWADEF